MNGYLLLGICLVNAALVCYTVFFFMKKPGRFAAKHLAFLSAGVAFDLTSTILMIAGSSKGIVTVHGMIGYSALLGMMIEAGLVLRSFRRGGPLGPALRLATRIAYAWWMIAYIAGLAMVAWSR